MSKREELERETIVRVGIAVEHAALELQLLKQVLPPSPTRAHGVQQRLKILRRLVDELTEHAAVLTVLERTR